MIKAIPTWYKGLLYRSRLESCWACFFDHLDIVFEYEIGGYTLPDGRRYSPDFWLPHIEGGIWAEVKGREPSDEEIDLAAELAAADGHHCVILVGSPMVALQEHGYPFLLNYWSMDQLTHAAIEAHRAVRWDPHSAAPPPPPVKIPKKVEKAWRRRPA